MLRSGPIYFSEASGATPKQQRFVKDLAMADLWIENDYSDPPSTASKNGTSKSSISLWSKTPFQRVQMEV